MRCCGYEVMWVWGAVLLMNQLLMTSRCDMWHDSLSFDWQYGSIVIEVVLHGDKKFTNGCPYLKLVMMILLDPSHSPVSFFYSWWSFKATLCNNLTLFVVWFYRQLVLVPSSSFILIAYGHVRDRQTPVSFPLAIQEMHYAVLCSKLEHPAKMEEKLSQHDIASYTAKRHQLMCWQASISVSWAVAGVCKVFAWPLGS